MLFHMYQVFSSLHGHLQFFVHFFFTFMERFFIDHPISGNLVKSATTNYQFSQTSLAGIACFMVYYVWARMCEVWL